MQTRVSNMSNSSTRGHAFKLSKHFSRVNCRAFSFANRFIDVWNSLENDIVTARRSVLLKLCLYCVMCRDGVSCQFISDLPFL